MNNDILIVDDEEDIRQLISGILNDEGYNTRVAWDLKSIKNEIIKRVPALILLDVWLENSKVDGIDLLNIIKKSYPFIPVIMISGHGTINMALKAIKIGAFDFIEKPFDTDVLILNIKKAIEISSLKKKVYFEGNLNKNDKKLIGVSQFSLSIKTIIDKIASTESRVLISGPSGSGKKFTARIIHNLSQRSNFPIIFANTKRLLSEDIEIELFGHENKEGIVTKIGLVEQAHNGTLVIDEIANLSNTVQSRFVKLLTEKCFYRVNGKFPIDIDIRLISSTSNNILDKVKENQFREDLYYRLNVVPIKLIKLNDRTEDIPFFIDHFLKVCSEKLGVPQRKITPDSYNLLQSTKWDGNIRQLKNVIEQLIILGPKNADEPLTVNVLTQNKEGSTNDLAEFMQKSMLSLSLKEARELFEREYIKLQMMRFNNNVSKTAVFIGMERSALHRKLKSLNIKEIY